MVAAAACVSFVLALLMCVVGASAFPLTVFLHAPSPSFGPLVLLVFHSFRSRAQGADGAWTCASASRKLEYFFSGVLFCFFLVLVLIFPFFLCACLLVVVPPLFIRPEGSLYVSISTLIMQTHLNSEVQVKCTCAAKFSPKNKPAEIPSRGWPRACPSLLVSLPLVVKPCPQVALL